MADTPADHVDNREEELEVESNYKPPPEKSIEQILETDKEDESLRKYKETLLGEAKSGGIVVDPSDPRKVIVKKLALCVDGRPDMELDLTQDLGQLKKQTFVIKEGVSYKIRIDFIVQREIVHGLKYVQKTYRLGVPVDKMTHMVGSYPPKTEVQSYTTPAEDAPAGVMARGSYTVSSLFTDDDKHEHLKWKWSFDIKIDWKEIKPVMTRRSLEQTQFGHGHGHSYGLFTQPLHEINPHHHLRRHLGQRTFLLLGLQMHMRMS